MSKAAASNRKTYAYDIEVYPNYFCVTFIHIASQEEHFFEVFADQWNKAYDRNTLREMINFILNDVRTLIGYNSHSYDDTIIKHLIHNKELLCKSTAAEICRGAKLLSDKIIKLQDKLFARDKYMDIIKGLRYFGSLDLMLQFNTIDRVSLKQLAINLRWPEIVDLPYDPDKLLDDEETQHVKYYNRNDTLITKAVFYKREDVIKQRKDYGIQQNANVLNANDTNIAKYIIKKYYAEASGRKPEEFTGPKARSYYKKISIGECISKKITFISEPYQHAFNKFRNTTVDPNHIEEEIEGKTTSFINAAGELVMGKQKGEKKKQLEHILQSKFTSHSLGLGGIHSMNSDSIYSEDAENELIDIDVKSYYPSILIHEHLFPRHLGPEFLRVYRDKIFNPRITAKDSGNAVLAEMLKITLNSTFGLTKSIYSWLYDPKVTLTITVCGQLYLMMLMERLELYTKGCQVVYSNTDGLTVKVPKVEKELFMSICKQWEAYTGFELEYANYKKMVIRDVNNFLMVTHDTKKPIKAKGVFLVDKPLKSGYVFPILSKALNAYYVDGIDPIKYVDSNTDIYDFMRAQRTSMDKFEIVFSLISNPDNHTVLSKSNRWAITKGNSLEGKLVKIHRRTKEVTELQKQHRVTLMNDLSKPAATFDAYNIHRPFYYKMVYDIIKDIKPRGFVVNRVKQASLL